MAKIDLKDAYLHIPVNKHFQRFLVVRWKNLCFQFKAMPFGLSIAPAVFSSLMNFPLKLLSNRGVQCIAYLDDWIVCATSYRSCQLAVLQVVGAFRDLGFLINWEKSVKTSATSVARSRIELRARPLTPTCRADRPHNRDAKRMKLEEQALRREEVEGLIGKMAFMGQISEDALFRKKLLGPVLLDWPSGTLRDVTCRIGPQVLADLGWWTRPDNLNPWSPIRKLEPTMNLWTDASEIGWSCHTEEGD